MAQEGAEMEQETGGRGSREEGEGRERREGKREEKGERRSAKQ